MLALEKVLLAGANYYRPKAQGQQEFTTPGTYTFIVPANVESLSMVAVGGGAGGAQNVNDGGGGGGGALAYSNNVAVTPGEALVVVVGQGGSRGDGAGTAGGQSSVSRVAATSQVYEYFETVGALGSKWASSRGTAIKAWGTGQSSGGFVSSGISGSTGYLRFGDTVAGFRQATTQPQDLTLATKIKLRYIYGNNLNGGEEVDAGEYLRIALSTSQGNSTDNTGYTSIGVDAAVSATWTDYEVSIPAEWKRTGVYIRLFQADSSASFFDHIGVDNLAIEYGNRLLVAAGGGQPGVGARGGNGGVPAGSSADINSGSVVMLLTGDGSDGSRNFVDSSPNPKTISNFQDLKYQGYPLQTTRFKKFGTGSIDFNGESSFYVTGGTDFVFGGDFTIEGWLWTNNSAYENFQTIWELNDYRNGILFRFGYATNGFYINGVNRGQIIQHFPALQWNHFAVVRNGSIVNVYANGVSILNFTETGVINSNGGPLRVGESNHAAGQFAPPMYIDEFRITKGVARYTANFVPPTTSSNDTTSLTNFTGYPGGRGGHGTQFFDGGNAYTGGGGGAGGYTGVGGQGGDHFNSGSASTGGGGAGGNADGDWAYGGGGTGIKGISNNGSGNGGGGSSYNALTDYISSNINKVDLYPIDLSYAWGNFLNTYGVWTNQRTGDDGTTKTIVRGFYAPYSGFYTVEYSADIYLNFKVDGSSKATSRATYGSSETSKIYINQGIRILTLEVSNDGASGSWYNNPAGFALTIRDTIGTLLWDTRTYASANSVNQAIRSVAAGTNGTRADGGFPGGGGGGRDDGPNAGNGGGGAVRIIWGAGRSYPYNAKDVTPVTTASTTGLILYYDAENAASYSGGSTVYDISGNANDGTISLGYAPASVPKLGTNKVIRFPATNTKIDFEANELTSSIITVEMWVIAYSFAGGMFFGFYNHDVYTYGGNLGYNTNNSDVYGISASRVGALNITGRWAHYVFVMNAGDYRKNKIYINGVSETLSQQLSSQAAANTNFSNGSGRIGGFRIVDRYPQTMDLGIFKIYNRELTQAEITTNYNERKAQYSTPVYYSGLWGKRVSNYYNDDVNFFAGKTAVESRAVTNFSFFSSYDNFYSWEFKGYFRAPADGTYTFGTTSDDASHLWIGETAVSGFTTGNALVNNGGLHGYRYAQGSIYLLANVYYPIRVQFGENAGADGLVIYVSGPTMPTDPESGSALNGDGYFFHDDTNKL